MILLKLKCLKNSDIGIWNDYAGLSFNVDFFYNKES